MWSLCLLSAHSTPSVPSLQHCRVVPHFVLLCRTPSSWTLWCAPQISTIRASAYILPAAGEVAIWKLIAESLSRNFSPPRGTLSSKATLPPRKETASSDILQKHISLCHFWTSQLQSSLWDHVPVQLPLLPNRTQVLFWRTLPDKLLAAKSPSQTQGPQLTTPLMRQEAYWRPAVKFFVSAFPFRPTPSPWYLAQCRTDFRWMGHGWWLAQILDKDYLFPFFASEVNTKYLLVSNMQNIHRIYK